MRIQSRTVSTVALAGFFCIAGCTAPGVSPEPSSVPAAVPAVPLATPEAARAVDSVVSANAPAASSAAGEALVMVPEPETVATLQPQSEPRYALPESLGQFRFPQKNQPGAILAPRPGGASAPAKRLLAGGELAARPVRPTTPVTVPPPVSPEPAIPRAITVEPVEPAVPVATVIAEGETPRYLPPDSLKQWRPDRSVPLYDDPEAAPWQASPTDPRLRNAAVSCNYKDEGGVRGKVALLVDDFKVTRFSARIEMPNGGVCQFDSKQMEQRPFEQGIALQSKGDQCVVRMWEQKHRITIAAYSCQKQCSKGSFSYLWPILMDTRIGTCY